MQTEKRDYLIYFSLRGVNTGGYRSGNESCRVLATKQIVGFEPVAPSVQQQSYKIRMVAWNYQMDVVNYVGPLVEAACMFGNRVQHKLYFESKYPRQITDWNKQLR